MTVAKVFIRSVADSAPSPREQDRIPCRLLRASAAIDTRRRHEVVDDPGIADIVLFVESHDDDAASGAFLENVLADEVYRRHADRCLVHSGQDHPAPILPGIYPSLEHRWAWRGWARSGCYLTVSNTFVTSSPPAFRSPKSILGSFVGVCGSLELRRCLVSTLGDQPSFAVEDSGPRFIGALQRNDHAGVAALKARFVELARSSRFLLCPRGEGASSIRLFEAMELGVAPVIISDDWTEPAGPRWGEFSLRVPERDLEAIPRLLREHASGAEAMGRAARLAWEEYYGPSSLFDTLVEDCLSIASERRIPLSVLRAGARAQLLRPVHARRLLRRSKFYARVRRLLGR
jgi:hypothetical protein